MKWLYMGVGIAIFVVSAVLWAPADRLFALARDAGVSKLDATGLHGTLVAGGADAADIYGVTLYHVRWRFQPSALLSGHLGLRISANTDNGHLATIAEVAPLGETVLRDVRLSAPLGDIAPALGLNDLPAQGQISAKLRALRMTGKRLVSARGTVRVGDVKWTLAQPAVSLGAYQATVTPLPHGGVKATLKNLDAAMALAGQLTLDGGTWTLRARLRPDANAPPHVTQLMTGLGPADSSGWHSIHQRGQL